MDKLTYKQQSAQDKALVAEKIIILLKRRTLQTANLKSLAKNFGPDIDLKSITERLILYDILTENIVGLTLTNRYKSYVSNFGGLFYETGSQYRHDYIQVKQWKGIFPLLLRNESLSGMGALLFAAIAFIWGPSLIRGKDEPQQQYQESEGMLPIEQKSNPEAQDTVSVAAPKDSTKGK